MADTKTVGQLNKEIEVLKKLLEDKAEQSPRQAAPAPEILKNEAYMHEPVTIKLFRDSGRYKDDVFVAVNDRSYLIRRGVEVTVPRFIEQALKNSLAQDEYVASLVERLVNDYESSADKA